MSFRRGTLGCSRSLLLVPRGGASIPRKLHVSITCVDVAETITCNESFFSCRSQASRREQGCGGELNPHRSRQIFCFWRQCEQSFGGEFNPYWSRQMFCFWRQCGHQNRRCLNISWLRSFFGVLQLRSTWRIVSWRCLMRSLLGKTRVRCCRSAICIF